MSRTLAALMGVVLAAVCVAGYATEESVQSSLYTVMHPDYCTRLLDADRQIGCTSGRGGNVGILTAVTDVNQLSGALKGEVEYYKKAILMKADVFYQVFYTADEDRLTDSTLKSQLLKSGTVNGVLVMHSDSKPTNQSPEHTNPNTPFNLHNSYSWNPYGVGAAFTDVPFPIVRLSKEESESMLSKASQNAMWAVEMDYFMQGKTNAASCLSAHMCQPIGGKSVWASAGGAVAADKEVVMAVASMDSTAMLHDRGAGADADISGAVAVIAAAKALDPLARGGALAKNLVFVLFNGESFGYIGSRRFVQDVSTGTCQPRDATHECPDTAFKAISWLKIAAVLEAKQVGCAGSSSVCTMYAHKETASSATVQNALVGETTSGVTVKSASSTNPGVPPSSLQAFLRKNSNVSHAVLADHDSTYKNQYYHGQYDDRSNVNPAAICAAATVLTRSMYNLASNGGTTTVGADCTFVTQVLDCLTGSSACSGLDAFAHPGDLPIRTNYAGVFAWDWSVQPNVRFVFNLLTNATATTRGGACEADSDCSDAPVPTKTCVQGACVAGEAHYHDAFSTGLAYDYENNQWSVADRSDSTWVESNWVSTSTRLFRVESILSQVMILLAGLGVLIGSVGAGACVVKCSAWSAYLV